MRRDWHTILELEAWSYLFVARIHNSHIFIHFKFNDVFFLRNSLTARMWIIADNEPSPTRMWFTKKKRVFIWSLRRERGWTKGWLVQARTVRLWLICWNSNKYFPYGRNDSCWFTSVKPIRCISLCNLWTCLLPFLAAAICPIVEH